jgi:ADP-ribose pyrophosphatase YjhB (NUDIX family)
VQAIARTGLHYSENPFDRERYERLLKMAAREYADRTTLSEPEVQARFDADIGYVTARVGTDAAVFDEHDRLLLARRVDDNKWGLIAGWVDPNESPEDTTVRELAEEAGIQARVEQLVGVFFRPAQAGEHPHGIISIVYLCSVTGGSLRAQEHEIHELAYRDVDDVAPSDWHLHHQQLARAARDAHWKRRAGL